LITRSKDLQKVYNAMFLLLFLSQSAVANIMAAPPCDLIQKTTDEFLARRLSGADLCRPLPKTDEDMRGPDKIPAFPHQSLMIVMSSGSAAEQSASEIGREIIEREEIAHCLYINPKSEGREWSYRFKFPREEDDTIAASYRGLISRIQFKNSSIDCSFTIKGVEKDICQTIRDRKPNEALYNIIVGDIRRTLHDLHRANDAAAGAPKLNHGYCADRIVKNSFNPTTLELLRDSNTLSLISDKLKKNKSTVEDLDSMINAAERARMDRVYLDFMKTRLDIIRR
jgi:hypothetical protein